MFMWLLAVVKSRQTVFVTSLRICAIIVIGLHHLGSGSERYRGRSCGAAPVTIRKPLPAIRAPPRKKERVGYLGVCA